MLYMIIFLIVLNTHSSVSYVGKACKSAASCIGTDDYTDFHYKYQCEDGICKCEDMKYLMFNDYSLTPSCLRISAMISLSFLTDETCTSNSSCPENTECVETEEPFLYVKKKKCQCTAGFMKLQNACRKIYHQRVLDQCRVHENGSVLFCDLNESSFCRSGRCICFDNLFANTTSGKCEPFSEYLQMHNLTEYRVSPGEYCSQDSHCIEGLACVNFSCSCPPACPYKAEDQICDCGEEPSEPSNFLGPLIVGILGGILIIAFWAYQIRKTIKRYGTKKRDQFDDLPTDDNEVTTAGDACALKPFDSHDMSFGSPGQLNPPPYSTDGRQSPVAPPVIPSYAVPPPQSPGLLNPPPYSTDGRQSPVASPVVSSYAAPPPQPLLYGINPPQAPYHQSPFPQPLQAENPSESKPPPYSFDPPTIESSATSLPYPIYSSAAPSSTNPTDMPSGLDPSAPLPSNPYGASAPPPYNPNHP